MKASELRLGNYLIVPGIDRIVQVRLVCLSHFSCVDKDGIVLGESVRINYQPIPLTEELLLKFGFEINRQTKEENNIWRCYSEEGFFEVEQIGSSFFLDDNHCYGTKINYVHHLQNLYFALTGEELILNA